MTGPGGGPSWSAEVTDYAVVALDPRGRITAWNTGAELLQRASAAEVLGRHFSMSYTDEDHATNLPARLLREARKTGRATDQGWRLRQDGTRFFADVVITALHDEDGALTGFAKFTRDRTDQHEVEERLRESEARYRLLVSQVGDYAIIGIDPSGVITSWNSGAVLVKGYSAAEAVGRHISMFYTEEDNAAVLPTRLLEAARADGRVEDQGWRLRKDGSKFWADVVLSVVHDDDGEVTGFAKVTRDVSDRHAAQEALEINEARLRRMVEQVEDHAIVGTDLAGEVTSWNRGAYRLVGWDAEDALGRHLALFHTDADRAAGRPARLFEAAAAAGRTRSDGERRRPGGGSVWVEGWLTAVRDDEGGLVGYVEVCHEDTRR